MFLGAAIDFPADGDLVGFFEQPFDRGDLLFHVLFVQLGQRIIIAGLLLLLRGGKLHEAAELLDGRLLFVFGHVLQHDPDGNVVIGIQPGEELHWIVSRKRGIFSLGDDRPTVLIANVNILAVGRGDFHHTAVVLRRANDVQFCERIDQIFGAGDGNIGGGDELAVAVDADRQTKRARLIEPLEALALGHAHDHAVGHLRGTGLTAQRAEEIDVG